MTEHATDEHVIDAHAATEQVDDDVEVEQVTTGNGQVDEVLRKLDELGELPDDQHDEDYEAAHEGLRDALKDARQPTAAHG